MNLDDDEAWQGVALKPRKKSDDEENNSDEEIIEEYDSEDYDTDGNLIEKTEEQKKKED